jgi:hypothetical protein
MTTTITTARTYWILEHSSRSHKIGSEIEAIWVHSPSLTVGSEHLALCKAEEIKQSFKRPGWQVKHRFTIRRVG